jgi:hypothetical protein
LVASGRRRRQTTRIAAGRWSWWLQRRVTRQRGQRGQRVRSGTECDSLQCDPLELIIARHVVIGLKPSLTQADILLEDTVGERRRDR